MPTGLRHASGPVLQNHPLHIFLIFFLTGLVGKNPSLGHYAHYVPTAATANLGYLNPPGASTIAAEQISRYSGKIFLSLYHFGVPILTLQVLV